MTVPPVTLKKLLRVLDGRMFWKLALPALTITPVPVPEVQETFPAVEKAPPATRSCCEVAMVTEDGVRVPPGPTCTMPLVMVRLPVRLGLGRLSSSVPTPVLVKPFAPESATARWCG